MSSSRSPSSSKQNYLRLLAIQVEKIYDTFHRFLAWATGRLGKPMSAEIYHAAQMSGGVMVKGRVLLSRKWRDPLEEDHPVVNFFQMLKRWATPERPNSLVRISLGGKEYDVRADKEAYFEQFIPKEECLSEEVFIELPESEVSKPSSHSVFTVGADSTRLIISDIDDTVLVTHAAKTLRMIATTLFGNALTRQLFPGSSELYQSLRHGKTEKDEENPITYVTSSPFNLHSLLVLIFDENRLPTGPFFMTDWGLDVDKWFKRSHSAHKKEAIRTTLDWYPEKPAILIGDSGQHDTMIYIDMALEFPDRIDTILIRDVSGEERREELQSKIQLIQDSDVMFSFFESSYEAAEILTQRGWISDEQRRKVQAAVKESEKSILETLTHAKPHRNPH